MKGSKLIIKNTGILYVKTFNTRGIASYSTRVILNILGAVDYRLFSFIAGVIAMLTFLKNSLSSAKQWFMLFSQDECDLGKIEHTFNMNTIFHSRIAVQLI